MLNYPERIALRHGVSPREQELITLVTSLFVGNNSNNKRVTIGKTTEMEFPFNGRRTTLLGKPNFAELIPPHRSCRPSLASVKLEAKFQVGHFISSVLPWLLHK